MKKIIRIGCMLLLTLLLCILVFKFDHTLQRKYARLRINIHYYMNHDPFKYTTRFDEMVTTQEEGSSYYLICIPKDERKGKSFTIYYDIKEGVKDHCYEKES